MPTPDSKKILVVEDDKDIQYVIKVFLEDDGYQVQTADDGFEALDLLKNFGVPDLILLDMKMPRMNGWQFANEFYNKYQRPSPIVVMTAAADAEQRAKDISAAGWIGKPFELESLRKTIKKYQK